MQKQFIRNFHNIGFWLAILLTLSVLSGCGGGNLIITPTDRKLVSQAQKIVVVHYTTRSMFLMTPKSQVGSGLIADSTKSAKMPTWGQTVKKLSIPDITLSTTTNVVNGLKTQAKLNNLVANQTPRSLPYSDNYSSYKSQYSDSDFVLEVYVNNLMANYQGFKWKTYNFSLGVQARLIRQKDSKLVWQQNCNAAGVTDDTYTWSVDDFYSEDGSGIKNAVGKAVQYCSSVIVSSFINSK